ncbi:NAD(P)H-binding protein [Thiorhodococcus fuscus]|uniref:NAD(P)H-binding protein n=1 Tax=Thiorhodococcus fuscus TaxID=527200 RepID=A0ABW4Y315_9GAMM
MQIALFGATSGTGQQVLAQALEQGHTLTALARDPSTLDPRDGLTTIGGDVLDCYVPCDYLPRRSYPLFRAREVLAHMAHEKALVDRIDLNLRRNLGQDLHHRPTTIWTNSKLRHY